MCRNNDHGGRRCPVDTTPQRRYRRKTASLMEKYSYVTQTIVPDRETVSEPIAIEELPSYIAETKTAIYSAPPENISEETWDAYNENRISQIGVTIAHEAENNLPFSLDETRNKISTLSQTQQNLTLTLDSLKEQLSEKETMLGTPVPDVKTMPGRIKYASLTDEQKVLLSDIEKLKTKIGELKQTINQVDLEKSTLIYDTHENLKSAYIKTLSSLRSFGGAIKTSAEPVDKNFIVETLGSHYPSDWIEYSNNNGDLIIEPSTSMRPEYRSHNVPIAVADTRGRATQIIDNNPDYETTTFTTDSGEIGQAVFYKDEENLTGDKITYLDKLTPEEQQILGKDILQNLPAGTLYHEFGHRMEQSIPEGILVRQEKAFLRRRTGKTEENWLNNMTPLNRTEFVHQGNFVSPYVGKEYFDGRRYEVFTTGIQALYTGEYGGLIGVSSQHTKTDEDHRNFVLGILATI